MQGADVRRLKRRRVEGREFEIVDCARKSRSTMCVPHFWNDRFADLLDQKSARSTTLLDSHSSSSKRAKKNAADDEPEAKDGGKEIWDRDRDMSITGRLMEDGARADVVKQAKELGGRFGGGTYL